MLIKTKKIILVLFFSCFISISYAVYTTNTSNSDYKDPIIDEMLDFSANLFSGKVYMQWAVYNHEEDFKYYKVVRSTTNLNPVYPEDGYIKYETNINKTSFIDENPPISSHIYYRVCAITTEQNRYCSNVVRLNIESSESQGTICTTEYAPVC